MKLGELGSSSDQDVGVEINNESIRLLVVVLAHYHVLLHQIHDEHVIQGTEHDSLAESLVIEGLQSLHHLVHFVLHYGLLLLLGQVVCRLAQSVEHFVHHCVTVLPLE